MLIRLHWWKEFRKDGLQNYGDLMSKYLVQKLSKKIVATTRSPLNRYLKRIIKPYYIVIGSVIGAASKNAVVWGSGIISSNQVVNNATFLAIRGPQTRNRLLELGYNVPEVYGDPALLIPLYIPNKNIKKFKLGVIPHFVDYEKVNNALKSDSRIKVIKLLTNNVEKTTHDILECEQIISSSLHGVIVPHAYGIPALWIKFSDKLSGDNIKFYDYYESVNIEFKKEIIIEYNKLTYNKLIETFSETDNILLPEKKKLEQLQNQLLKACPFK